MIGVNDKNIKNVQIEYLEKEISKIKTSLKSKSHSPEEIKRGKGLLAGMIERLTKLKSTK